VRHASLLPAEAKQKQAQTTEQPIALLARCHKQFLTLNKSKMARQLFVMGAIFIGLCMVVAASAAGEHGLDAQHNQVKQQPYSTVNGIRCARQACSSGSHVLLYCCHAVLLPNLPTDPCFPLADVYYTEWKASRKMLQWNQWATSDAIGRAVDSGADMWSTRNAAAVGTWGGWGGRNWVGKH
jgi:hypothetical protein